MKQPDPRQVTPTIRREAEFYRIAKERPSHFERAHLLRVFKYDRASELLVLEYLDDVMPLGNVDSRADAVRCAARFGTAIARLHNAPAPEPGVFDAPAPWAFLVCRPTRELINEFSGTSLSVFRIIHQTTGLREALVDLAELADRQILVHGDLRLDNCLISEPDKPTGSLFFVDWELAGLGDPGWDIGGAISEYLAQWLRSMPLLSAIPLADSLKHAGHSLETSQATIAALWNAYRRERTALVDPAGLLERSIRCAGARLIQSAVESAQSSAALTKPMVYALQLAENLILRPTQAQTHLIGLDVA